jgi:O-antigen/teichoic acid export membrane protein
MEPPSRLTILGVLMRSRVLWRRAATAAGVYGAALVGFLATVIAARELDRTDFGLLTLVMATTGFLQMLFDFTIDEALLKFGFRYVAREDYGRLRRLFRVAAAVKLGGGAAGTIGLLALAPFADAAFGERGLLVPLLIAAAIPLVQSPEGLAGTTLLLRNRMDIRAAFLLVSMALRLAGIAVGAAFGVREAVLGMVAAQVAATLAVGVAGRLAFRRFPTLPLVPLGDDAPALRRFAVQSSIGTGIGSARATFPAVLVGLVTGAAQVAYFRVAQAPQTAFASLSAPARLVLLAEQTHDFEHGRIERMRGMLTRYMLGTSALLVAVVPVLWWQMPAIVRAVYGAKYEGAVDATRLILAAAAVQVVWGWTKSFPVSIGRPALRILTQGIEVAVLVPVLLVLGWQWGATGAAAAIVVASAVFAAVWTVLLVRLRKGMLALPPQEPELPRGLPDELLVP